MLYLSPDPLSLNDVEFRLETSTDIEQKVRESYPGGTPSAFYNSGHTVEVKTLYRINRHENYQLPRHFVLVHIPFKLTRNVMKLHLNLFSFRMAVYSSASY